jgi:hypothetical protein
MDKKRREIECLDRLQDLTPTFLDILLFLTEEKIITAEETTAFGKLGINGKTMQNLLFKLQKNDKLQLLEYEWTVLPVERIKILIVTDRNTREFSYDGA